MKIIDEKTVELSKGRSQGFTSATDELQFPSKSR